MGATLSENGVGDVVERRPSESASAIGLVWRGLAIFAIYLTAVLGPFSLLANGTRLTDLTELTLPFPGLDIAVTAALVGLFALYWTATRATRRGLVHATPIVLTFTALFSATLVFLYPVTAMDVYNYAVQGHVLAFDNLNPLVYPPASAGGDGFVAYAGSWASSPSPYGPVWLDLTRWIALIAGFDVVRAVLLLKGLAALAVVGTTWLLAKGATRGERSSGALAAILFGWNPLVQIELVGNGHNDAVMVLGLVVTLGLLAARRPALGAIALASSALVKYLTAEAVPFILFALLAEPTASLRQRLSRMAASLFALVGTATIFFAPYWLGPITLDRVRVVDTNYLSSFSALAILLQPSLIDWLALPRLAILIAVGLWQVEGLWRGKLALPRALFEVSFATILVANHFAGWYLPLLVTLAILADDSRQVTRSIVFTFTATLATPLWAYVWPANQATFSLLTFHLMLVPLTFLPPLVVGLLRLPPLLEMTQADRN
jgi:hypothetical protein